MPADLKPKIQFLEQAITNHLNAHGFNSTPPNQAFITAIASGVVQFVEQRLSANKDMQ